MRGVQLTQNFLQHRISLFKRGIIPKPHYQKAFRFEISRPLGIADKLLSMLPAIQFHDQLFFKTNEIDYVGWNRMLSAKFETVELAIFQTQPKSHFRIG